MPLAVLHLGLGVLDLADYSLASFIGNRLVKIAVLIAVPVIIYTEGATAYLNTQKAIEAKAVAANALLRQKSESNRNDPPANRRTPPCHK